VNTAESAIELPAWGPPSGRPTQAITVPLASTSSSSGTANGSCRWASWANFCRFSEATSMKRSSAGVAARRVHHLQHRSAGQAADDRLEDQAAVASDDAFEVAAIAQVERAPAPQRVAMQLTVRADGQDAGVLGIGLAHC
jgi:hypothetical protein